MPYISQRSLALLGGSVAAPNAPSIGIPSSIGTRALIISGDYTITTTATVNPDDWVCICIQTSSSTSANSALPTGVTDSQGGTWTLTTPETDSTGSKYIAYAYRQFTTTFNSGQSITIACNANTGSNIHSAYAFKMDNCSGIDFVGTALQGTGNPVANSVSTTSDNAVIFSNLMWVGAGPDTQTLDPDWTTSVNASDAANGRRLVQYKNINSGGTISISNSTSNSSRVWVQQMIVFIGN